MGKKDCLCFIEFCFTGDGPEEANIERWFIAFHGAISDNDILVGRVHTAKTDASVLKLLLVQILQWTLHLRQHLP